MQYSITRTDYDPGPVNEHSNNERAASLVHDWCDRHWVEQQLVGSGTLVRGHVVDVTLSPAFPETDGSFSSSMDIVTIDYSVDAEGVLPRRALLKVNKPAFWAGGRSEALFYRFTRSQPSKVATPQCYGIEIVEEAQQCRLLLELMEDEFITLDWDQHQRPDVTMVRRLLSVLAELHVAHWGIRELPEYERVPMDRTLIDSVDQTIGFSALAERFIGHHVDLLTQRQRMAFRCFGGPYLNRYKDHMDTLPQTLIHGDAHFWNCLMPVNADAKPVLVDWEAWSINAATFELVYAGIVKHKPSFAERHEHELIDHYRACLLAGGVDFPEELFWLDLRHSIIRDLFVVMYMAELVEGMQAETWQELMLSTFAAMDRHDCWVLMD
ncbi:MAG: phosphotransferase [Pseudomonadota bacterium]